MIIPNLHPLNDFTFKVELRKTDTTPGSPTFGKQVPLTTGTVTAFLSTENLVTSTTADASLVVTCTHLANGVWLVHFDASILTVALLDTHFAAAPPFCHVVATNDVRRAFQLAYSKIALAEVA